MKRITLTLLLVVASICSYAQEGFHAGLIGNFNTIWIVNQESYGQRQYDYKLDLGGGGGVQAGYNITNHIGFLVEIKTSSEGQKYADHDDATATRQVKLNYIAVPVLFKFIGGSVQSDVKFYAQAGIQYNILTGATILDNRNPDLNDVSIKPRYTSSDLGVNFGLGADITLTKYLYLSTGMSFYYSFNDINAAAWQLPDLHGNYKQSRNGTGGISIGLNYQFAKGK